MEHVCSLIAKNQVNNTYGNVVTGTRIILHTTDVGFHIYVKGTNFLPGTPNFYLQNLPSVFSVSKLASNLKR